MKLKTYLAGISLLAAIGPVLAQVHGDLVRIGVLTDFSGVYSDITGKGAVIATQMAIDDFLEKEKPSFKVEMISADHQNKGKRRPTAVLTVRA